jgi:hypothetical protein
MSLPKQCLYTNKINSSYARNFQSAIAPQNGSEYNFGETIILNIPTGANLVASGQDSILKFNFNFRNGGAAGTTYRLNRSGAYSIFQRMRIFLGSTLLSDIDAYGNLMDLLITTQQSTDAIVGKYSIMAGTTYDPENTTIATVTDATISFAIPLVSILSWSQNYVPLFAMSGPLRIELQLVSNIRQFLHSAAALTTHSTLKTVDNIELVINMMEISDSGMNIIKSAIGNSPIQWVVQDYKNYQYVNTLRVTTTQLSVPIPAKFNSLNSLLWTFRNSGNVAGLATFPSNESLNFDLKEYFVRLGARTVPTKPPNTLPEFCCELLRSLGSPSDVNHECNIKPLSYFKKVPAIATICGAFYLGLDLESYSNTDMTSVYSGYNSSKEDILFTPTFNPQPANGAVDVRIDTYALYDCLISLENGVATAFY